VIAVSDMVSNRGRNGRERAKKAKKRAKGIENYRGSAILVQ
jgi:hypothetical protein